MGDTNRAAEIDSYRRRIHALTRDSVTHLLKKEGLIDGIREGDKTITDVLDGPVAVVLVDFDNLKNINDTYGHAKGDDYLRIIANEIDRYAWGEDDNIGFAFRGKEGDEIVIALSIKDKSQDKYKERVKDFASELQNSLVEIGKKLVAQGIDRKNPSLSLGSFFKPDGVISDSPDEKIAELLQCVDDQADKACYVTKKDKSNRPEGQLVGLTFFEDINNGK